MSNLLNKQFREIQRYENKMNDTNVIAAVNISMCDQFQFKQKRYTPPQCFFSMATLYDHECLK